MTELALAQSEVGRVKTLHEDQRNGVHAGSEFDDITFIASVLTHAPIAILSAVVDNELVNLSIKGISAADLPPTVKLYCEEILKSFAGIHIIHESSNGANPNGSYKNANQDEMFVAGLALLGHSGERLGVLCVLDSGKRSLTKEQESGLEALGRQAVATFGSRKVKEQMLQIDEDLNKVLKDVEMISHLSAHDLKSPLNNIISLTFLLKDNYGEQLDEDAKEYLQYLNDTSYKLSGLVNGISEYSKASLMPIVNEVINYNAFLDEIINQLKISFDANIKFYEEATPIYGARAIIKHIIIYICSFSIRNNSNDGLEIEIDFYRLDDTNNFIIRDNGDHNIDPNNAKLFDLMEGLKGSSDAKENYGMLLPIASRLVNKLDGSIKIISEEGKGTSFIVTLPQLAPMP
jgi:signal transduction histidine kinase